MPIDKVREPFLAENDRLGAQGLRVMATAQRDFDPATFDPNADLLPLVKDLQLLAIVGIVDPPRAEARDAIAKAKSAGIKVRMITGDHAVTADAIARQLGIEGQAMTGADFRAMSDEEADRRIDDIGVIARVAPEDKVHLVDILRRKGHIVAMTGDGVNDAPALKMADIGVAMGITGTEVSKEAAVMILTDDNFATIVTAVEQGRALYDNLLRYIRFQMACLFGFIGTFLGASIFGILGGVPFLPLQTLWINFTVDIFQAIGLGYGKQREGLMEEAPRPKDQQILPRPLFLWLAFIGLTMAAITLAVIVWAGNNFDETVAHTMGLVTFSMLHLFFSLETSDEERTLFSSELLENSDPAQDVGPVAADDLPGHHVRPAPAGPRHGGAQRRAVGDLHRRGRPDHHRGGDPQGLPSSGGRDRGRPGGRCTAARGRRREVVERHRVPMSVIIPRWEFRTFGQHFGAAEAAFGAMTPGAVQESDEVYLLVDDGQPTTDVVKIRFDLMDVKTLREVNPDGLERWEPVAKVAFPLAPADLAIVTQALRLPSTPSDDAAASLDGFLAEVVRPGGPVRAVAVHKRRVRYAPGGCTAEVSDVTADGQPIRTIAIEDEDPAAVVAAVRSVGLGGYVNTSYPVGLAALLERPAPALRGDRRRDELGQVPPRRAPG